MVIKEKISLSIEIGLENGLSYPIVFHHSLLHFNGVVRMIYQLVEIMMVMDEVITTRKFVFLVLLNNCISRIWPLETKNE